MSMEKPKSQNSKESSSQQQQQGQEEEKPRIEVETPVGSDGEKLAEERKQLKEEEKQEQEKQDKQKQKDEEVETIKQKKERGELLSGQEAARLREAELTEEEADTKKTEKTEKKEKKEKTPEEQLQETRDKFARLDREAEKWMKIEKKHGGNKDITKEDFAQSEAGQEKAYKEAKEGYLNALAEYRKQKLNELEGQNLSTTEKEKKKQEILKETIVGEASALYESKINTEMEEKEGSKKEKIINAAKGAAEWYEDLSLKKKLGISAALIGGGVVSGGVGGVAGAVLAGSVTAGNIAKKGLVGGGTAVGLEGLMKKRQEKKSEKEMANEFTSNLEEKLNDSDQEVENKLFELEGRKKGEKIRRYILAGTAGALVGSGAVGKAIGNVAGYLGADKAINSVEGWFGVGGGEASEKAATEGGKSVKEFGKEQQWQAAHGHGSGIAQEKTGEAAGKFTAEVKQGDSMWNAAERELQENFGDRFNDLNEAQKAHLIDNIKDKVAENPEKFGLEPGQGIDNLHAGEKINFSSVLGGETTDKMFDSAQNLSPADMDSIMEHNDKIEQWVSDHPNESLTSEKVKEILAGETGKASTSGKVEQTLAGETGKVAESSPQNKEIVNIFNKYNISFESAETVDKTLDMIDHTDVKGPAREALKDVYFTNWAEAGSPENVKEVMSNIFGDNYDKMEEFFSHARDISLDDGGNIHMTLDHSGWANWDNWDVVFTRDGDIVANGPSGWGVDKQDLNKESLQKVREHLSKYVEKVDIDSYTEKMDTGGGGGDVAAGEAAQNAHEAVAETGAEQTTDAGTTAGSEAGPNAAEHGRPNVGAEAGQGAAQEGGGSDVGQTAGEAKANPEAHIGDADIKNIDFNHDSEGNIVGINYEADLTGFDPHSFIDSSNLEGENAATYVESKNVINAELRQMRIYQEALQTMQEQGAQDTQQYEWVKDQLNNRVDRFKDNFGNFLNEDEIRVNE